MIAFHLDMKMALLRPDALRRRMADCARQGYDTLLWEVEDAVAWETAPECASAGAYSKAEFKDLLAEGTRLGLAHVPLLQTLGHFEYLLRHPRYAPLRENPDSVAMVCPLKPELLPLLHRWIAEYLEVFGPVTDFHIGADEARDLGFCPDCQAFSAAQSKSRLFIDHVNAVAAPLLARGIRPLVWADMIIHHPEALARLDRRIAVVDWLYERHAACGKAHFFGFGSYTRETLPDELLARFGRALYPQGDEPGRDPDPFFQGAYLAQAGLAVITAPGASSSGDSVFTSRNWLHVLNSWDSARRGAVPGRAGVIQTSWSIRLNPYDLQEAAIAAVPFAARHPEASLADFQTAFETERFGAPTPAFWAAAGLLSKPCLFSASTTLNFNYPTARVPADQVKRVLKGILERQELAAQTRTTLKLLADYREAQARLAGLGQAVRKGREWLAIWEAAARQLENRADTALLFLEEAGAVLADTPLEGARLARARTILARHLELRAEAEQFLLARLKKERVPLYLEWMYGIVEGPLGRIADS